MQILLRYIIISSLIISRFFEQNLYAQICNGTLGDPVVSITFGTGIGTTQLPTAVAGAGTSYAYFSAICPNDGYYTVTNTSGSAVSTCFNTSWHYLPEDHTPNDVNGRFAIFNASYTAGEFYKQTVSGLCGNTTYEFGAWVANILTSSACEGNGIDPNLQFTIESVSGKVLGTYNAGEISESSSLTWKQYSLLFTTPPSETQVVIKISNLNAGGCGNDIILDDITFRPCVSTVSVTASPASVCAGGSASLTGSISPGYNNPVFQWQQSTDGGNSWSDIAGATSTAYNISNAVANTKYRLLVAENGNIAISYCRIASNPVPDLVIYPLPELIVPSNQEVCIGTKVDLNDFVSIPSATYNWRIDNTSLGLSQASGTGQVPVFTATAVGTITFTVSATGNCTSKEKTFTVKINPNPEINISGPQSICAGKSATISATVTGGTQSYSYIWNNGLNTNLSQTVSPTTSTAYTFTATDSKGCKVSANTNITVNNPPIINSLTKTDAKCNGQSNGTITVLATGAGALQYSLDGINFSNNNTFGGLAAGTYTVTVKDENGCTTSKAIDLGQPEPIAINIQTSTITCSQGSGSAVSISTSGGVTPYSYSWSDGVFASSTIAGRPAGTYTLTVTDANGCTKTANVTITQPIQMSLLSVITNVSCNGGNDGKIDLTGNSKVPIVSYLWSNGKTTEDISGLTAGSYTVTATDADGCKISMTVTVKEPAKITTSFTTTNISCNGGKDGKINFTAAGGAGGLLYAICNGSNCTNFGSNQATGNFENLAAGTYKIKVTDANNCVSISNDISLTQPNLPIAAASSNSAVCTGADLKLLAANAGTGASYQWSGPNGYSSKIQNPVRSNAQADMNGIYILTVTDANGCTNAAKIEVTVNELPKVDAGKEQTICQGSKIELIATASGGQPDYKYSWDNGSTGASTTVNPSSTTDYSVIITDVNGCQARDTVRVNVLPSPTIFTIIPLTKDLYCGGTSGLPIQLTGSQTGVLYELVKNGVNVGQGIVGTGSAISFGNQLGGNYTVKATSNTNPACVATMKGTLSFRELPPLAVSFPFIADTICYGSAVTLTATASGGSGSGYQYSWQNGKTGNTQSFSATAFTLITATVTDNEGCSASAGFDLRVIDSLSLNLTTTKTTICAGESITLTAQATGSSGSFVYEWENGSTNPIRALTPNTTTTYIVKTIDTKKGCTKKQAITINVIEPPKAYNITSGSLSCSSTSGTLVGLSGSQIGVNYQLKRDGNNVGSAIAGTGNILSFGNQTLVGVYTIEATTNTNPACSAVMTGKVEVIENQIPKIMTNAQPNVVCEGQKLTLSTSPTLTGASYTWTGPNNFTSTLSAPTISNVTSAASGEYNVTVKDANGCIQTGITYAKIATKPIAIASSNSPKCEGDVLRLSAADAGIGAVYTWKGPNGFYRADEQNPVIDNITVASSGVYTLYITKDGCTNSVTTNVTIYKNPIAVASSNSAICEGEKLNLSANNGGIGSSYQWTGPAFSTPNLTQNPSIIGAVNHSGRYVLTVSLNGCVSKDSILVTVKPRPTIIIPKITTLCEGEFLSIPIETDPSATDFSWTGPNGFLSPERTAKIENTTTAATGIYVVKVTLNGCASEAKTDVVVNPKPKAVAVSSSPVCEGETVVLSATDAGKGATYNWYGPNNYTSSEQNNILPNATLDMSGTYLLVVNLGNCQSKTETKVTVYPKPKLEIGGATCDANLKTYSIKITAEGGEVKSSAGNIVDNGGNSYTILNVPKDQNEVTISVISNEGCEITKTTTAPNCSCPIVSAPSNPISQTICKGQPIPALSVSVGSNETADWYESAFGGTPLISNTTSYTPTLGETYYVQTRNLITGCISTTRTAVTLSIKPTPEPVVVGTSPICEGDTLKLFGQSSLAGVSYSWSKVGGGFSSNSQNIVIPNASSTDAGTYTLTLNLNGCSVSKNKTIVIKPKPHPIASNDSPKCEGSNVQLSANAIPSAIYKWSGPQNFASDIRQPFISNTKLNQAGKYFVKVILDGCVNTDSTIVNVYPKPTIIAQAPTCAINLATYSLQVTATGGTVTASSGTVTNNGGGSYTISGVAILPTPQNIVVYVTSPQGCKDSVAVKAPNCQCPIVNAPISLGNPSICKSSAIPTLKVSVGTNETADWYDAPTGGNKVATATTQFTPTVTTVGTYTFYVEARRTDITLQTCTSSTRTAITLTIKDLPIASASSNGVICEDEDLQLSAQTVSGATFQWTSTGFSSTEQNPIRPKAKPSMSGKYYLKVTLNGCESLDTIDVRIKPKPIANASVTSLSVCEGTSIQLKADSVTNASYNWGGVNGFSSTIRNPTIQNATLDHAGLYGVQVNLDGCTNFDTVSVVVRQSPIAQANNTGPVCEGNNVILSANNDPLATYSWENPYGNVVGNSTEVTLNNVVASQSGVYKVFVTKNNCTKTDTTKVIINALPSIVATGGIVCEGGSIQLKATTIDNATYHWTGPNAFSSTLKEPIISDIGLLQNGVYTLTITLNDCSKSDTALISVKPMPVAQALSNSPICVGDTLRLNAANAGIGAVYTWKTPVNTILNGQNITIAYAQLSQSGKYVLTTSLNGCSNTDTTSVQIKSLPTFTLMSNAICEQNSLNLSVLNAPAGSTFTWSGPNQFSSSEQNPSIPKATLANSGLYEVTVKLNGCTKSDTITAKVKPLPLVKATAITPICEGDALCLNTDNAGSNAIYSWTGLNFTSSSQTPKRANATAAMSGQYKIVVTLNGCIAKDSVNTLVHAKPSFNVIVTKGSCTGYTVNSDASISLVNVLNGIKYDLVKGKTYTGNKTVNDATTIPSSGIILNNIANPDSVDYYSVRVFDISGCFKDSTFKLNRQTCACDGASPVVIPESQNICQGDTFQVVHGYVDAGYTVDWYDAQGNLLLKGSYTFKPTTAGIYYAQARNILTGCVGIAKSPSTASISPKPSFNVIVTKGSCTNSIVNSDASIALVNVLNGIKYDLVKGKTYTGNKTVNDATAIPSSGIILNNIANPDSVDYYSVRVFDISGCFKDSTFKLNRQTCACDGASPVVIPESQNICKGDTFQVVHGYVDAGYTVDWYDAQGNLLLKGSYTFKPTTAGIYYAQARNILTGCVGIAKSPSTATISPKPSFNVIVTKGSCTNSTVNSDASISLVNVLNGIKYDLVKGKTYTGNKTVNDATAIPNSGIILNNIANPDSVDYYSVRVFDISGCFKDSTFKLNKQTCACDGASPVVIPESQNICKGDTFQVVHGYVDAGYTVDWYDAQGNLLLKGSYTFKPTTAGIYYAQARNILTGCVGIAKSPSTAAISPKPSFNVIVTKGSCTGYTVNSDASISLVNVLNGIKYDLVKGKTYTGNKTVNDATTIPSSGIILNNIANPDSVDYYSVRVFDISGCFKDSTFKLNRQTCACDGASPVVIPESQNICKGDTFQVVHGYVDAGYTVDWYDAQGNLLLKGSYTFKPTTAGIYYAQARNILTGCVGIAKSPSTASISPKPSFNVVVSKGSCTGYTVNSDASIALVNVLNGIKYDLVKGKTYTGNKTVNDATTIPSSGIILNNIANPDSVDYYSVRVFDISGCFKDSTFKLNRQTCACDGASPIVIPESQNICQGDTFQVVHGYVDAGYTVDWYDAQGNLLLKGSYTFKPTTAGIYYAQARNILTGCVGIAKSPSTASISPKPSFMLMAKSTTCAGKTVQNDAKITIHNLLNGKRFDYSIGNKYVGGKIYDTAQPIPSDSILVNNIPNPKLSVTYTVRVFDGLGCYSDQSITILEAQCSCNLIPVDVIPASFAICKNDTIPTFTAFPIDPRVTVNWYDAPTGGNLLASNTLKYKPSQAGIYYAEGRIDNDGCVSSSRTPATLRILSNPDFALLYKPTTCIGDVASSDGQLTIQELTDGSRYDYSIGNTFTKSTTFNTATTIPANGIIINNLSNLDQTFTVRVFNSCGLYKDRTIEFKKNDCKCPTGNCFEIKIKRKTK